MTARRVLRWFSFLGAAGAFAWFVFFDHDDLRVLAAFFACGGLWVWLERRKMRELDALYRK